MPLVLARSDVRTGPARTRPIEIGLLNNLSDAGLEGGDRQIVELLREAAGAQTVRLHFFSLPSIPRGEAGRAHIASFYTDFSRLRESQLDGLFVTGCEPRTQRLPDETFWPQLAEIIDWAEHNTRSTMFSCLAAHAAVLHLDGIERRPLKQKCTGLFRVEPMVDHPLLAGAPSDLRVSHSRYNALDETELTSAGYEILTRGPVVGVDTFVKKWRSLFIYLQGHPEYDGDALRREYRRDVIRFLDCVSETYPGLPAGYFGPSVEASLRAFASRAKRERNPKLIEAFPLDRRGTSGVWHRDFAITLFRNWLDYLHAKTSNHAA